MIDLNDVLLAMSNIPVDDPIAEIWGRGLQGGYKIIKYTGTLPINISANGDALIDYRIYGADGGVGEPTENLYNKNDPDIVYSAYMNYAGTISKGNYGDAVKVSGYIPINGGQTYTGTNLMNSGYGNYYAYYDANKQLLETGMTADNMVFNSPTNAAYIRTTLIHRNSEDIAMLTEGSTAPESYEPYGYKLPMTVGDGNTAQTVPVYIGENQLDSVEGIADYVDKASGKIVRMIGEYTFTGDESFNKYGNSDVFYTSKTIDPVGITTVNTITMRCNHSAFTAIENKDTRYWLNPEADNICCFLPGGRSQVFLRSTSNFTTDAECEAYLKAQYDNGTPVKISYWLKTPVEEDPPVPLPEIPTIKGETIIDYDGTPKPSQMYVKYKDKG